MLTAEIPQCLLMEDDDADNSDLDIDICAITPPASPSLTDDMSDSLPQMEELLASLNGGQWRHIKSFWCLLRLKDPSPFYSYLIGGVLQYRHILLSGCWTLGKKPLCFYLCYGKVKL